VRAQAQRIVPEEEWEAFMASARSSLPATFRINGGGKFAAGIRDTLRTDFVAAIAGMGGAVVEGDVVQPPHPLPWCATRAATAGARAARAHARTRAVGVRAHGARLRSPNRRLLAVAAARAVLR
jgi:hypothetical protein